MKKNLKKLFLKFDLLADFFLNLANKYYFDKFLFS